MVLGSRKLRRLVQVTVTSAETVIVSYSDYLSCKHQLKQSRSELELYITSFHLKPSAISSSSEFSSTRSSLKRSGFVLCNTPTKHPHLQSEIQQVHDQPTVSATAHQSPGVNVCKQKRK